MEGGHIHDLHDDVKGGEEDHDHLHHPHPHPHHHPPTRSTLSLVSAAGSRSITGRSNSSTSLLPRYEDDDDDDNYDDFDDDGGYGDDDSRMIKFKHQSFTMI